MKEINNSNSWGSYDRKYNLQFIVQLIVIAAYVYFMIANPLPVGLKIYPIGILIVNMIYHIEIFWGRIQVEQNLFYENIILAISMIIASFIVLDDFSFITLVTISIINILSLLLTISLIYKTYTYLKNFWQADKSKQDSYQSTDDSKHTLKKWLLNHSESLYQMAFIAIFAFYLISYPFILIKYLGSDNLLEIPGLIFIGAADLFLVISYLLWRIHSKYLYLVSFAFCLSSLLISWGLVLIAILSFIGNILYFLIGYFIYRPVQQTGLIRANSAIRNF